MENQELPSDEKAIIVRPDVQPNAKNCISHVEKQTKGLSFSLHLKWIDLCRVDEGLLRASPPSMGLKDQSRWRKVSGAEHTPQT